MKNLTSTPEVYADLHTHTQCSDGAVMPAALVEKAADRGIAVLSVTDHDTVAGLDEAAEAAQETGIHFVPGVELSVSLGEEEIHLLAYDMEVDHPVLRDHLQAMREARRDRAWAMIERLRDDGLDIADGRFEREMDGTAAVGRPHVAAVLVRAGHAASIQEAFERYLGSDGPGYVPKPEFPAEEALGMIHEAGGLGVLAHPGHWTTTQQVRELTEAGLDGIEVHHPSHSSSLRGYYQRLADGYNLLCTGGSDYHGRSDADEETFGTVGLAEPEWERFWEVLA